MGGLVSRWRAKPSTVDVLECMEKEIQLLEEFREKNHRQQKLWVGRLLIYSSIIYLLTCLIVYCWYLPEEWSARLLMALPCLTFPVLIWMLRLVLLIWFSRRTQRSNDALEEIKLTKKKILEDVMEKETYKTAKLILERFDPDSKKAKELEQPPTGPSATPRPGQELRQRNAAQRNQSTPVSPVPRSPLVATPGLPKETAAPGGPPERGIQQVMHPNLLARRPGSPMHGMGLHPPGPPLARPILPRERSALDRVVEYLVGDGPQNRYALICQQCFSHNGMALKEEFEYVAFRCAYCYFLNPARKTRPHAPRLQDLNFDRNRLPQSQPTFESPPCQDGAEDADDDEQASESAEEMEELADGSERTSGASTPCTDQPGDKLTESDKEAVLPATADGSAITNATEQNEESLIETE